MSLSSRFKMDSTDDISNESPLTSPKESDYKNFNDTFQSAIDDSAQKFVNYDTSLFTNSFEVNESQLMHQNEAGEKEVDDIEVNFSRYSALQPPLTPPPPPLPKSGFNMRSPSAPASNSTCRSNQSKPGRALIAELEQHHFRSSRVSRVPSKSSDRSCSALPRLSNNKESEKFDFNEANSSNLTKMDRLKLTDSMPKFDGHVKKLASEFGLKAGKKTVISMTGRNFRSKETASEDVPDTRIRSPEFQLQTSSSTSKTGQSSPVFTYKNSSEFTNPINSSPSADARLFYDANSGSKHNSPGNVLHDDYFDSSPESMTSSPPMSPVAQKKQLAKFV